MFQAVASREHDQCAIGGVDCRLMQLIEFTLLPQTHMPRQSESLSHACRLC
jgi:hypothetical protein